MNYRDILDAAFAAEKQKTECNGNTAADAEAETEAADCGKTEQCGEKSAVAKMQYAGIETQSAEEGGQNTDGLQAAGVETQDAEHSAQAKPESAQKDKETKTAEDGGTDGKNRRIEAIEKAVGLLRLIKSQAEAAAHDLDLSRAAELDGLAGILSGLCEIFADGN